MPSNEPKQPEPPEPRPDISLMTPEQLAEFAFHVLKDIDVSRLRHGTWISMLNGGCFSDIADALATPTECQYCAVGAVLLANGIESARSWMRYTELPESLNARTNAAFLRGLSRTFEAEEDTLDGRKAAMAYAEALRKAFKAGIDPETVDPRWHSQDCIIEDEEDEDYDNSEDCSCDECNPNDELD